MPNQIKPTLTKGIILKKKELGEYLVKNVFNQKEIIISITGKEKMNYSYEEGDIVYFAESISNPKKGKLMTPTGLKYNSYLSSLKAEVDRKYAELKSGNEDNLNEK